MDGSNDGSDRPGGDNGGRRNEQKRNMVWVDNMRERYENLNRDLRAVQELRKPYLNEAQEQITRALGEEEYSIFTRMWASTDKARTLRRGTALISSLAGINGRSLEQPQVDAVAECLQAHVDQAAKLQVVIDAGVVAATVPRWRKPPVWLRGKGRLAQRVWPAMLILAYYIPVQMFVQPIFMAFNSKNFLETLKQDSRLQGWKIILQQDFSQHSQEDRLARGEQFPASSSPSSDQSAWSQTQTSWGSTSQSQPQDQGTNDSWDKQPSAAWGSTPQSQRQEQTPSDSWDSLDADDDASPIAPSHRVVTQPEPSDSAWDRLRQQAATQNKQLKQSSPNPQTPNRWSDLQTRGVGSPDSKDSYSYSSADLEKSTAKEQAQREFDQLLDRERQGEDQGNKRWW